MKTKTEAERKIEMLINKLKNTDWDDHWKIRQEITRKMIEIGEPAVLPLIDALCDGNPSIRHGAADILGFLGDKRAVEPLIAILNDSNPDIRRTASNSLGLLGDKRAVGPMIRLLEDDDESSGGILFFSHPLGSVRRWAMDGLFRIGESGKDQLVRALKDDNDNVRKGAEWVLKMIEKSNMV